MLLQGWTAVHCATSNRRAVAMLVAFGADINAKSIHVSITTTVVLIYAAIVTSRSMSLLSAALCVLT